jgi:hypothetical protein
MPTQLHKSHRLSCQVENRVIKALWERVMALNSQGLAFSFRFRFDPSNERFTTNPYSSTDHDARDFAVPNHFVGNRSPEPNQPRNVGDAVEQWLNVAF